MEDQGKRLLIAVAIAFAIMLGWTYLFPPEAPEKKPATDEVSEKNEDAAKKAAELPSDSAAQGGGETTAAAPVPRGPEQEFEFTFGQVRATFSSYGGALKSWELLGKQFHVPGQRDKQEDLVRLGHEGLYDLGVGFAKGSTVVIPEGAEWKGEKVSDREMKFTWSSPEMTVEKIFRITPEEYLLELEVRYQTQLADAEQALMVTLYSLQDPGDIKEGGWTSLPREWKATCYVDEEVEAWGTKSLAKREHEERGEVAWAGFSHSYFLTAAAPRTGEQQTLRCRASAAGKTDGGMRMDIIYPNARPAQDTAVGATLVAYFGPKYLGKLQHVSELVEFDTGLEKAVDLGFWSFIAGPLLWLLQTFHGFLGSWGLAIILLTVVVKLATLYWTHKSMKSMRAMSNLRPQLDKLRDKYKDDRQKQQLETMALFKAHGVNPLAGCLPMLLQMPIWFALYRALSVAAELYQAKFMWFADLTAPDPYFILPIFVTVLMLAQARFTPTTGSGMQQKMLMYGMPLMFGGFSLFFPAGLTLYIATNTVLSLLHHIYVRRTDPHGHGGQSPSGSGEKGSGKGAGGKVEELANATALASSIDVEEVPSAGQQDRAAKSGRTPGKGGGGKGGGKKKRSKR